MPHVESPAAPVFARIGLLGADDVAETRKVAGSKPRDRKPGGGWDYVRGNMLYPALIATVSLLSRIVSRDKDELR